MCRLLPVAVLAVLLMAPAGAQSPRAPLLLISIDGLRPDYVIGEAGRGVNIPNLRRLAKDGAYATGAHGVAPSLTYPSHATIVTGVSPAKHGILSNATFDPFSRNIGGRYWYAEDIRVPTLWDAANETGMVTSAVAWPVTVGAKIRYNVPEYWRAGTLDDQKIIRSLATPGLLTEMEQVLGPYPDGIDQSIESDRKRVPFNVYLIEKKRPGLHLAMLYRLDHAQHDFGPFTPPVFSTLEEIDRLVGELQRAALTAGGGAATICVVSDHGFAASEGEVNLNAALKAAGLITLDASGRVERWRAFAWNGGASAIVMLNDPHDADARATVRRVLADLGGDPRSGVRRFADAGELTAAAPGAAFVVGLAEGFRAGVRLEGPITGTVKRAGTHGYLPDVASMNASFFVSGPGIAAGRNLGEIDLRDIAPTLAGLMGLNLPTAEGRRLDLQATIMSGPKREANRPTRSTAISGAR